MKIPAAKIWFPKEDQEDLKETIGGILESGQLTLGKHGAEFERRFADYIGTEYAVAVNSGTAALEIILRAYNLKGHTVIVPTNTFFATPAAVLHAGCKVQLVDVGKDMCISPDRVLDNIRMETRAVITVHIGGAVSAGTPTIRDICEDADLFLIEDAAHAHGSTFGGKKAGSLGDAAAFSFYPTKVMTSGEGGMITTNSKKLYESALVLRDQGKVGFLGNIHTMLGYNWRMSEVHAAIGISQLKRLDEFIAARRRVAAIYDKHLCGIPVAGRSNYYKYCMVPTTGVSNSIIKRALKEQYDISLSGEVYERPCHLQPVFSDMHNNTPMPVAEDLCQRHICLPVYATMTDEEAAYVAASVQKVI